MAEVLNRVDPGCWSSGRRCGRAASFDVCWGWSPGIGCAWLFQLSYRVSAGEEMMTTSKVDFSSVRWGSVEWTNLVTLYLRAHESRSRRPILGDHAAAEAVDRIDYDFKRMQRTMVPAANQYLVALRAKQLDDWCADFLHRHPEAVVLHLACGVDARVLRLVPPPSVLWFDLDQPAVIELRRRLYDDTEHYRMIGSSVTDPEGSIRSRPGGPRSSSRRAC